MFGTASYLPRVDDFHPSLRRGHGSTHACLCVSDGCELNRKRGGEAHGDKAANVKDWKNERRLLPSEKPRHPARVVAFTAGRHGGKSQAQLPNHCSSCGHVPNGAKNDLALELGLCRRCWARGHGRVA